MSSTFTPNHNAGKIVFSKAGNSGIKDQRRSIPTGDSCYISENNSEFTMAQNTISDWGAPAQIKELTFSDSGHTFTDGWQLTNIPFQLTGEEPGKNSDNIYAIATKKEVYLDGELYVIVMACVQEKTTKITSPCPVLQAIDTPGEVEPGSFMNTCCKTITSNSKFSKEKKSKVVLLATGDPSEFKNFKNFKNFGAKKNSNPNSNTGRKIEDIQLNFFGGTYTGESDSIKDYISGAKTLEFFSTADESSELIWSDQVIDDRGILFIYNTREHLVPIQTDDETFLADIISAFNTKEEETQLQTLVNTRFAAIYDPYVKLQGDLMIKDPYDICTKMILAFHYKERYKYLRKNKIKEGQDDQSDEQQDNLAAKERELNVGFADPKSYWERSNIQSRTLYDNVMTMPDDRKTGQGTRLAMLKNLNSLRGIQENVWKPRDIDDDEAKLTCDGLKNLQKKLLNSKKISFIQLKNSYGIKNIRDGERGDFIEFEEKWIIMREAQIKMGFAFRTQEKEFLRNEEVMTALTQLQKVNSTLI